MSRLLNDNEERDVIDLVNKVFSHHPPSSSTLTVEIKKVLGGCQGSVRGHYLDGRIFPLASFYGRDEKEASSLAKSYVAALEIAYRLRHGASDEEEEVEQASVTALKALYASYSDDPELLVAKLRPFLEE